MSVTFWRRRQRNRDLEEEIRAHLTLAERDARESRSANTTVSLQDSAAARREFGNVSLTAELTRDQWPARWLFDFFQDARFALRVLRKNPGFTAVAVLTLALGIGATTAIFSAVDTILLRPLPYTDSGKLVFFFERPPREAASLDFSTTLIDYTRMFPDLFSQVAALMPGGAALTGVPQPQQIETAQVSSRYFSLLGWHPAIGRDFVPDDEKTGAVPVAVLSDSLWKSALSADPGVIGRTILLDNVAHTIIGVMPQNFENPLYSRADLWLPRRLGGEHSQWIARLAGDADSRTAQARLTAAEQSLPGKGPGWQVALQSLRDATTGDVRAELLILLGCAAFVLLVACANVANLLLARGAARRLELNVRSAIGAGRWRIVRQMLTESILLGLLGGLCGLAVSYWTLKLLLAIAPQGIVRLSDVRMDARVLFFALAASLLTALLFGALPALRLTRVDLSASLKEGAGTGAAAGVRHSRALGGLVGSEVALALILTLGASLMVRSFLRLRPDHPGFDPVNKISFRIQPAEWKYGTAISRQQYLDQLAERIESLPSVKAVAIANYLPFSGMVSFGRIYTKPGAKGVMTNCRTISPNYFQLMNVPLFAGRAFTDSDNASGRRVAIVSRGMAEQFWPGENALGKHFTADGWFGELEVVGIVGDTRESGISLKRWAEYYVPIRQTPTRAATFVVSFLQDPAKLVPTIRAAVLSIDKDQPLTDFQTLEEMASANVSNQRFEASLVGSFATVALLLAAVGIFGVISYSVRQRARELGIRIALGASSQQIARTALGSTTRPVAIGLLVGWGASFWLSRLMSSVLFGISPTDAVANLLAVAAMILVAALAGYLPARRATKFDPATVLRHE